MNGTSKNTKNSLLLLVLCFLLIGVGNDLLAQQAFGLSVGYEIFPYVKLTDPIKEAPELEIQTSSWSVGAAFPLAFAKGKVLVLNYINYKRTDFSYRNFPPAGTEIEQAKSIEYTFFMIDSLSQKWKLVAVVTPGLASDFKADLSNDDFTFAAVFGFIRRMGRNFQLGFGLAYTPDFGEPLPLPFLYIDWKISSNLNANGIIPTNISLVYKLNPSIDLGVSLKVDGNRYHGDPDRYGVDNPLMKYSEGTVSPLIQLHLTKWFHLNVEGGFAFYRNFEFFNGDEKVQSNDLKQTWYLRAGLVIGM